MPLAEKIRDLAIFNLAIDNNACHAASGMWCAPASELAAAATAASAQTTEISSGVTMALDPSDASKLASAALQ